MAFQIREETINDSTNDVRRTGKSSEEWGEVDPYVTHIQNKFHLAQRFKWKKNEIIKVTVETMNYNHHLRENTGKVKRIKIITFFMTKATKENIHNKKGTI